MNSQFWSANVSEICLSSSVFQLKIPVAAPSLRSLFFEKRLLSNLTLDQWVNHITATPIPTFTPGCYEIGFNVGGEAAMDPRARLGIVSIHRAGKHKN